MHFSTILAASMFYSSASACLYFNATLYDSKLTVHSWDDKNNNRRVESADIICTGSDLSPTATNQWTVPCSQANNAKSATIFDVFLEPNTKRFLDVIYRYSNPDHQHLNFGENQDEFYFNFRVGSVDGKFFKAREFCAQQDILALVKPESLKNPCDSLDTC